MAEPTHIHKTTLELRADGCAGHSDALQVSYSPQAGVVFVQADVGGAGWTTIAEMTLEEFGRWVSALDKWATFINKV